MELTHNDLEFTAPLTATTTAVVGMIVNLALFFRYHVLWPQGSEGAFDWIAALIAFGAAVALFRYKCNMIRLTAACALVGLLVNT